MDFDFKIFKEIIAKRSAETAYKLSASGKYRNRNVEGSVMKINGALFHKHADGYSLSLVKMLSVL